MYACEACVVSELLVSCCFTAMHVALSPRSSKQIHAKPFVVMMLSCMYLVRMTAAAP
jgi:hypothetical protein